MLQLLRLAGQDEVEAVLREALSLMLHVAEAKRGYIEAIQPEVEDDPLERWWAASALSEERIEAVRRAISRGIIGESIRRGEVIETVSAFADPRFSAFDSVRRGGIEAVLCVPIGPGRPVGVLYLEGRKSGGRFGSSVRHLAELFAAHAAPAVERVIVKRREAGPDPTAPFRAGLIADDLLGRSAAMAHLLEQIALVAPVDISVLLSGPSGSGKSEVARVIVRNGPRSGMPLIELNCAAIPDTLLESELFGATAGAHSTALHTREGRVQAAEGGTLFLDEISELSPRAQAKLLQLIQDKTYFPLGSATPRDADIRVIAATHRDLRAAVDEGTFRRDLYYRLSVMPIVVPGLDARLEDIPLLVRAFARRACAHRGLPALQISPSAISATLSTPWAGHIRELKHAVEAAVIRAHGAGADTLQAEHLFPAHESGLDLPEGPSLFDATRSFQRGLISDTLEACGGSVAAAARQLRVARSHLYKLIKTLELVRPSE